MLRYVLALLAAVLSTACTSLVPSSYTGSDAGYVVMSMYEQDDQNPGRFVSYAFFFRKVGASASQTPNIGRFNYSPDPMTAFLTTGANYTTANQRGATIVASLPPGDYELYNYNFVDERNMGQYTNKVTYFANPFFSVPFTVRPGAVAYLGSYRTYKLSRGPGFAVTDRGDQDMPAAIAHMPALSGKPVSRFVPR